MYIGPPGGPGMGGGAREDAVRQGLRLHSVINHIIISSITIIINITIITIINIILIIITIIIIIIIVIIVIIRLHSVYWPPARPSVDMEDRLGWGGKQMYPLLLGVFGLGLLRVLGFWGLGI